MDPQLSKQLNRRRLILKNSLENSIKDEGTIKKNESCSIFVTDEIVSSANNTKNNFLEKIKVFESFSDHQINKIAHQNIAKKGKKDAKIVNNTH